MNAKRKARTIIADYLSALKPENFSCAFEPLFCFRNHIKLVAAEDSAYLGSQNYSEASKNGFECGLLIKGQECVKSIVDAVLGNFGSELVPYPGTTKKRFLFLASELLDRLSDTCKEVSKWFKSIYNDLTDEDELNLSYLMVRNSRLSQDALMELVGEIGSLHNELSAEDEFSCIAESIPSELLIDLEGLAEDDDLWDALDFDFDSRVHEIYAVNPPHPEEEAEYLTQIQDEVSSLQGSVQEKGTPLITELYAGLEKLLEALAEVKRLIAEVPVTDAGLDNTGQ